MLARTLLAMIAFRFIRLQIASLLCFGGCAASPDSIDDDAAQHKALALLLPTRIEIVELLCDSAWAHLEAGDDDAYLETIADCLNSARRDVDVVVLAQVSMARAPESGALRPIDPQQQPSGCNHSLEQLHISPRFSQHRGRPGTRESPRGCPGVGC